MSGGLVVSRISATIVVAGVIVRFAIVSPACLPSVLTRADNPKLGRAGGAQRKKPCTSRGTASWKTPLLSAVVVASCVPLRSVKRQTALAIGECGRPSSTLPCKVAVVAETEGGGTFPPPLTPPLP